MRKKLPKINGRIGALPPLDGHGGDEDKELSSKRARSLQESPMNALSPPPENREINLTKVEAKAEGGASPDVDNSTVNVKAQW